MLTRETILCEINNINNDNMSMQARFKSARSLCVAALENDKTLRDMLNEALLTIDCVTILKDYVNIKFEVLDHTVFGAGTKLLCADCEFVTNYGEENKILTLSKPILDCTWKIVVD